MVKSRAGFTIVELLIVIVVIAILATISIVAYNGIQQRAKNTKIIASANQVVKAITGYIATNGSYPLATNGSYCIVSAESSCRYAGQPLPADTTLNSNLQTISTLPSSSVSDTHSNFNGIVFLYSNSWTFNGTVQPARVYYTLHGEEQQCGAANIALSNGGGHYVSSTTGWTSSGYGTTHCMVVIAGP